MPSIIRATTTNGLQVAPDNSGSLALQTNGTTTAVTIDTSQNVGIGVTPSAWSNVTAFQIESGSLCAGSIDTYLSSNAFYSTASPSGWKYISSANATQFYQNAAGGEFVWRTAASGTAGNAITFTEAMRIDSSGNLLIGTTSTTYGTISGKFIGTSQTSGSAGLFYTNFTGDVSTSAFNIGKFDNNNTTSQIFVKFGINNAGLGCGQINGNGSGAAAFGSFSDSRLKENIVDLPSQLKNVLSLRPVEFDYIESEGGGHQTGFIAQEMQEVYPDAVGERSDGMLTISGWDKTTARLVKAIQEQQTIINDLKARIETLEAK